MNYNFQVSAHGYSAIYDAQQYASPYITVSRGFKSLKEAQKHFRRIMSGKPVVGPIVRVDSIRLIKNPNTAFESEVESLFDVSISIG